MDELNINSTKLLSNGLRMPVIGLGVYRTPEGEEVVNAVKWAIQAGYRLIDTAKIYQNEAGVGRGIKESGTKRENIFVTTKLWNTDQGYETTLSAIDESLGKLAMDHVDLYLVHWPTASPDTSISMNKRRDTWKAMEEIYRKGKARAIGVSNFTVGHLEEMKSYANVMPMVNQVEFHPFLYQKDLLDYCVKNGITLEAYRLLANAQRMGDPVMNAIAKRHGKSVAQVFIRWGLEHGLVVIPKSVQKERIEENLRVFDFSLTEKEMEEIDSLNQNHRFSPDPTNLL